MVLDAKNKKPFNYIWAILPIGLIFIISALYLTNSSIGIENFSNSFTLPMYTIIPGTLVILSIWALTRSETIKEIPRTSLFWLFLSFTFWFLAEQTWNLYEHVFIIDPWPSVADFFYMAAPIFMLISFTIFLKSISKKISKKKIILASCISAAILIPSLTSTLQADADAEPIELVILLGYPTVDAILLVPVIITILILVPDKLSFFWLMMLAGIIIFLAADSIFLYLQLIDEYEENHPQDILWVSSYTIWSFMMAHLIYESKKINGSKESETYTKYGSKRMEKYGIFIVLILINSTVVILISVINYFTNPNLDNNMLSFFSWVFIMTVIIFSSIVIILNSKLNKTLQNRTLQLEKITSELIKSERFSAIGELAARISHDIRNPLSNLQMSVDLIKNSPPDTKLSSETINEKLELASKNIERISHQVNDVLGFVKDRQLKKESFKFSDCLRDTIESLHIPRNVKLKILKSNISVFGDYFQLQIVCNNIIINAIQSIGNNYGEILIDSYEDDGNIIIEIENSGPRIPDDVLPHIFDSLVTTKQIGTGLGLVSCKTIIENHNGSIVVRNDPTKFIISLPKK